MDKTDEIHNKPEGRRRVMQVVEIEDETPNVKEPEKTVRDTLPPEPSPYSQMANELQKKEEELPATGEKQKELVSELFKKPDTTVGYPDISVKKRHLIPPLLIWIFSVFVLVGIIGGALILYKNSSGTGIAGIMLLPSPTPQMSPTPIATPTPAIQKKDITIQILNGSGKAGVAGVVKKLLTEKGYTVSETGNAKRFDYGKMEIYVKEGNSAYLDLLTADLSLSYPIGSTAATLESKASVSARIIVGKESI